MCLSVTLNPEKVKSVRLVRAATTTGEANRAGCHQNLKLWCIKKFELTCLSFFAYLVQKSSFDRLPNLVPNQGPAGAIFGGEFHR